MASFEFTFGDFSEEERKLLNQPSCVELPSSWVFEDYSGSADDTSKDEQNGNLLKETSCQPCINDSSLKDENHNHMPNKQKVLIDPNGTDLHFPPLSSGVTSPEPSKLFNGMVSESQPIVRDVTTKGNQAASEIERSEKDESKPETAMVNGHTSDNEDLGHDAGQAVDGAGDNDTSLTAKENFDKLAEKDSDDSSKLFNSNSSPPPVTGKSWASLFSGTSQPPKPSKPVSSVSTPKPVPAPVGSKDIAQPKRNKPTGIVQNGIPSKLRSEVVEVDKDPFAKQLADHIARNEIVYRSPGLMPRGFINSGNWCYVNATLQALLTSSPFCHLMRSLPSRQASDDSNVIFTSTPILDSFVRLVKELKPLPKKNFQRPSKDQFQGTWYEPEYIYEMLSTIKSKFSEKGLQQDAEEFLSCVLNGLHEEMLKVKEFYSSKSSSSNQQQNKDTTMKNSQTELGYEVPVHDEEPADDASEDQDQWEEVTQTRKNKGMVMRRADISKTPVSDVFRGELRSDLFQEGQRATATLEPFFTLPLDIKGQKTWSVAEALEHLTRLEDVHDFTNSKTKAKVDATRRQTLETLPAVLILQLKRFVYDKEGGLLKIGKEVQYHTDLVIGKDLLSKSSKKIAHDKRTYKLFAVVYHHGKEATGGHYTSDVYHDGLNCWLRIDDQHIKTTNVHEVVRHNPQRTAYLLYYKRTDLMAV